VGVTIDLHGYFSILFSRMAVWEHYIILFGGFFDRGITSRFLAFEADKSLNNSVARYLNDLWILDTQEYKWTLVKFEETDPQPL